MKPSAPVDLQPTPDPQSGWSLVPCLGPPAQMGRMAILPSWALGGPPHTSRSRQSGPHSKACPPLPARPRPQPQETCCHTSGWILWVSWDQWLKANTPMRKQLSTQSEVEYCPEGQVWSAVRNNRTGPHLVPPARHISPALLPAVGCLWTGAVLRKGCWTVIGNHACKMALFRKAEPGWGQECCTQGINTHATPSISQPAPPEASLWKALLSLEISRL